MPRPVLTILVCLGGLLSCGPAARPPVGAELARLRLLEVDAAELHLTGELELRDDQVPPLVGARYLVLDERGPLGEVRVGRSERVESDHGPDGRGRARFVRPPLRPPGQADSLVALGPLARPLPRARILATTTHPWDRLQPLAPPQPFLLVDLDGDGVADLRQVVSWPSPWVVVATEVRQGARWQRTASHVVRGFIPDREDRCPEDGPPTAECPAADGGR
jgi:hypothetical protein